MAGRQTKKEVSQGKCALCGEAFSKTVMAKHLASCKQEGGSAPTSAGRAPKSTKTFLLKVEGRFQPEYWMFLEAPATATLLNLDGFLRSTWLECCGHLSAFTIGDKTYAPDAGADFREFDDESMEIPLADVLTPGLKFRHDYDFGSTTELMLQVL